MHDNNVDLKDYIARVKDKNSSLRLMGFGHRVYKSYDPRASIMKDVADKMLNKLKTTDPLLEIAKRLEDVALNDPYFIERKLYPNVDFYSGVHPAGDGDPREHVHRDVRHGPDAGMDRQLERGARQRQRPLPSASGLHGTGRAPLRADRQTRNGRLLGSRHVCGRAPTLLAGARAAEAAGASRSARRQWTAEPGDP